MSYVMLPSSLHHQLTLQMLRPSFVSLCCAEYWGYSLLSSHANTMDKLQATAARAYLRQRNKHTVDWFTSKVDLNSCSCWKSLEWRRQILTLVYFHHLYYFYPSLHSDFHFTKSSSSCRPSSDHSSSCWSLCC